MSRRLLLLVPLVALLSAFGLLSEVGQSRIRGLASAQTSSASPENDLVLDFSETQFRFVYPMDGYWLVFKFRGTNRGTTDLLVFMDQAESESPGVRIHFTTPQGTTPLAPGESMWFKVMFTPAEELRTPRGRYNFTFKLRFAVNGPDFGGHRYENKTVQIEVVDCSTLAGSVTIRGTVVDEEGHPIPDAPIWLGGLGPVVDLRSDRDGHFSRSLAESEVYFLTVQKMGYRTTTLEIDGRNVKDSYTVTLVKETSPISVSFSMINVVRGNIGFWRCATTADESKLLLVNCMENWEDLSLMSSSKLYLLDTRSGEVLWTQAMGWQSGSADITDDGKFVVFGTLPFFGHPQLFIQYMRLLNGTDGHVIWERTFTPENFPGTSTSETSPAYSNGLKFSHNGEFIFVPVDHEYCYLLSRLDGSIIWRKWVGQNIREVLFTRDDRYVYVPSGSGWLYKLRVDDGTEVWKQWIGCWAFVNGFDLSSDEKNIAVGTKGGGVSVINAEDGSLRFSVDTRNMAAHCRFSPDGTKVVVAAEATMMFDLDGNLIWRNPGGAPDVRFSGDGRLIFAGNGAIFDAYGTLLLDILPGMDRDSHVGWINSDATRFIFAVRDTPTSENNIVEVYQITVTAAPISTFLSIVSRSPEGQVTDNRPTIAVQYVGDTAMDLTSARLLLDGVDVTNLSSVNSSATLFRPQTPLSEGVHTLYFEIKDTSDNIVTATWSFTVVSRPADYTVNIVGAAAFVVIIVATATLMRKKWTRSRGDEGLSTKNKAQWLLQFLTKEDLNGRLLDSSHYVELVITKSVSVH
jgi:outer membrane protein assembly factor BamB